MRLKTIAVWGLLSCLLPVAVNSYSAEAAAAAQLALEEFLVDFNAADNAALREHLHFPHITHNPNGLIVVNTASEFEQDFAAMRGQGWRRSTFDRFQLVQESDDKVHLLVDFRRYDANGSVIMENQVFYVMTRQDGRWGMQYRSGGPRPQQVPQAVLALVQQEATAAVYRFFESFNAADVDALFGTYHVPQAVLNGNNYVYAADRSSPIVSNDFARLRSVENWSHSVLRNLHVTHAMPGKVIFDFEFDRYNTMGQRYRTVPALWVLTEIDGKWGVQYRSLMPPI